jgi:hypothetical protein
MAPRQAFLSLTHFIDAEVRAEYGKRARAAEPFGDSFLLFHQSGGRVPPAAGAAGLCVISDAMLSELGYRMFRSTLVPGSVHFLLMRFFLDHPGYDRYWFIEYDVRFSGDWRKFFGAFQHADDDLLTCRVRRYHEEPGWGKWHLEHPSLRIPVQECLRSFNPIMRLSRAALEHLDEMQRAGWRGHNETSLPTFLHRDGFGVRDFGGSGSFVRPPDRNRFYIDAPPNNKGSLSGGTMRYRPAFAKVGWRRGKLYHPVKPKSMLDNTGRVRFPFLSGLCTRWGAGSAKSENRHPEAP